jgi:hypothetical protein
MKEEMTGKWWYICILCEKQHLVKQIPKTKSFVQENV